MDKFSDYFNKGDNEFIIKFYAHPCYEYQKIRNNTSGLSNLQELDKKVVEALKNDAILGHKLENPQLTRNFLNPHELKHAERIIADILGFEKLNPDYDFQNSIPTKVNRHI